MTQSTKESKTLASLWLTMLIVLSLDFTEAPAVQRGSRKDRAEPQPSWHGPASSSAPRPRAQQQLGSPILTPYEGQASCVQVLLIAGCIGAGPSPAPEGLRSSTHDAQPGWHCAKIFAYTGPRAGSVHVS